MDNTESVAACLRDLDVLSRMPAWWIGRSPREIPDSVATMLASMLRADTVYVQLKDPESGKLLVGVAGVTRGVVDVARDGLGQWGNVSAPWPTYTGGPIRLVQMPIGADAKQGSIVVGSRRPEFPTELETLLLRVAANQVAIAVEQTSLLIRHPAPIRRAFR